MPIKATRGAARRGALGRARTMSSSGRIRSSASRCRSRAGRRRVAARSALDLGGSGGYDGKARELAQMFAENFATKHADAPDEAPRRRRKVPSPQAGLESLVLLLAEPRPDCARRSQPAYAPRLARQALLTAAAAYPGSSTLKRCLAPLAAIARHARPDGGGPPGGARPRRQVEARQGHMGVGGPQRRYITRWLNGTSPRIAGQCPLT